MNQTLPDAARAYIDSMPDGTVDLFALTPLDNTGVPCWNAVYYDSAPQGPAGVATHGVGYGSTDGEAIIGATGELAEVVHSAAGIQRLERRRGSYADLARSLGRSMVADPLTLCLPAGSPVNTDTVLDWVPSRRYPDGATVWLPIDIAACAYHHLPPGYEPFITPITNGLGAGPSLDFAIGHGLCELFQRDGNGLNFRAMDRGILLEFGAGFPRDPRTRTLLAHLHSCGIEVLAKFADDEFGIANVYCVGGETDRAAPAPIMVTAAGEAASPDREQALHKALLEFAAARVRKAFSHGPLADAERVAPARYLERLRARPALGGEEGRTMDAMRDWLGRDQADLRALLEGSVLSRHGIKRFDELPQWDRPLAGTAVAAELHRRLDAHGMSVLVLDYSPAGEGVHVVKVVVPGLEVETMSYHRIGERGVRKLLLRGSPLVGLSNPPDGALPVRLPAEAAERLGGTPWLDVAAVDRLVSPVYPLYREPKVHAAQIAMDATA